MSELFFIIKPDAMKNKKVKDEIYEELNKFDVDIKEIIQRKLSTYEVDMLWPKSINSKVLNGLLKCYMTFEKSEIVFFSGNVTIENLYGIKLKIREKYAKGKFANCLHTPEDKQECYIQAQILKNYTIPRSESIEPIALNIWEILEKNGWDYSCSRGKRENYRIRLLNDDYNSIDFISTTISKTISEYSIEICYILTLQAEQFGGIVLYGNKEKSIVDGIEKKLRNERILVKIEDAENS